MERLRLHVVNLPHVQASRDYCFDAYAEKVRRFVDMLVKLGHQVYLYGSEDNETQATEFITCITKAEQQSLIGISGPLDNGKAQFDVQLPYWQLMNARAIAAIQERANPRDFICLIAGRCQEPIAQALPHLTAVEFGIGYGGVFAKFKVFESWAWMHCVYGSLTGGNAHDANGQDYDAVIPNYYEVADFPFVKDHEREDYFLFVGRLIDRKGYQIAVDVCKREGLRLKIAGQGAAPDYGEYLGVVGIEERGELMSKARGLFVPTQYIGPFEGVNAEARLCGTPVISTDWGCFTEHIRQGVDGFRCRDLGEFVKATRQVDQLDYAEIRRNAVANYSTEVVSRQYEAYFNRLLDLWGDGWNTVRP